MYETHGPLELPFARCSREGENHQLFPEQGGDIGEERRNKVVKILALNKHLSQLLGSLHQPELKKTHKI